MSLELGATGWPWYLLLTMLFTAVTARLAFRERARRAELAAGRARIEALTLREGDLIPGIAHALNNPVGIILGSVELLLRDAPEDSQRRRDLERIRLAARSCANLGRDLQAYAQAKKREAR